MAAEVIGGGLDLLAGKHPPRDQAGEGDRADEVTGERGEQQRRHAAAPRRTTVTVPASPSTTTSLPGGMSHAPGAETTHGMPNSRATIEE